MELNFFHFSVTPASQSYFAGDVFLNEFSTPYGRDGFSVFGNLFLLFNIFFLQVETVIEISGNLFFWETLFPLVERDSLSSENCFFLFRASFLQVETVTEAS